MKNFILSFILPRRMEEHRDMNLFIAIILFFLSMIICAGIPPKRMEKVIKKNYISDALVFDGTYEATFEKQSLPVYTVVNGEVEDYTLIDNKKVYDIQYKLADESVINLKIVYQFDVDNKHGIDKDVFSIDEYLKIDPFNTDHSLKQKDVLAVFTKTGIYYIYNHGYLHAYTASLETKLEEARYLNPQVWASTNLWSMYEHELIIDNGKAEFTENYYHPASLEEYESDPTGKNWKTSTPTSNKIHDFDYTPVKRYNNNLYELFNFNGGTNYGYFSYKNLELMGKEQLTLSENPLVELSDLMVNTKASDVRTQSYILSFFFVIILPIIWVLIIWLIMHKNGELVRFREYYAVASVSFLIPSIIIGIVGLFIPYYTISRFAMLLHAAYYFICVTRINSMSNGSKKSNNKKVIEAEVETNNTNSNSNISTKPIDTIDYNNTEIKKEENRSHVSQVE